MLFNYQIVDDKITLFYSLKTGKIKCYCTGVQDMEYFGEDKEDYNYGVLVVENDNYITQNLDKFIVEDGELILLAQPPSTRYKIK